MIKTNKDIPTLNRLLRALYGYDYFEIEFIDGNPNNIEISNIILTNNII